MTEGLRWTRAALGRRASGPCRTVPGTIMPTGHDAFQTYFTVRLHNKIKTMKRMAYGFRDPEFFKLKILAIHETRYALVG